MRQELAATDGGAHMSPTGSRHDEWWTPQSLFEGTCRRFGFRPVMDYAATAESTKCGMWMDDSLHKDWLHDGWLNPPNSKMAAFVKHAWEQHRKNGVALLILVPINILGRIYTKPIWDAFRAGAAEIEPIYGRPSFLPYGVAGQKGHGHNEYCAIFLKRREEPLETVSGEKFPAMFKGNDMQD